MYRSNENEKYIQKLIKGSEIHLQLFWWTKDTRSIFWFQT